MQSELNKELVKQRLYRIFRLQDEDYIITVMLFYIYNWVYPQAGDVTFDVIEELRQYFKDIENKKVVYKMYKEINAISISTCGRYDTSTKAVPMRKEKYVAGWHL